MNILTIGGATICPCVEIGEESISAVGSIVTKNTSSKIIVAGNPAKKIKNVEQQSFIKEDIRKQYKI